MRRFAVDLPPTLALDPALGRLARPVALVGADPRVERLLAADGEDVEQGAVEADRAADAGAQLLLVEATDTDAAPLVVLAALLDLEPVAAVGTASAAGWAERVGAVRDGLRLARPHLGDPPALVTAVGSGQVARLAGALAQSAVRRTPVLLDGSAAVAAAAMVAERLAPGAAGWWVAGSAPRSPAARAGLADLGLEPLLDLGLAAGGGELALGLLLGAARA